MPSSAYTVIFLPYISAACFLGHPVSTCPSARRPALTPDSACHSHSEDGCIRCIPNTGTLSLCLHSEEASPSCLITRLAAKHALPAILLCAANFAHREGNRLLLGQVVDVLVVPGKQATKYADCDVQRHEDSAAYAQVPGGKVVDPVDVYWHRCTIPSFCKLVGAPPCIQLASCTFCIVLAQLTVISTSSTSSIELLLVEKGWTMPGTSSVVEKSAIFAAVSLNDESQMLGLRSVSRSNAYVDSNLSPRVNRSRATDNPVCACDCHSEALFQGGCIPLGKEQ